MSPAWASSFSAPWRSGRPRRAAGRRARPVVPRAAHRRRSRAAAPGRLANSVTRGSVWRSSSPARRSARRSRARRRRRGRLAASAARSGRRSPAGSSGRRSPARRGQSGASTPFGRDDLVGATERRRAADERIVWLIVSPVASAAAMIAVPSIEPDDDQRGAAAAAAHVAHAEAEEDAVAQREDARRAPSAMPSSTDEHGGERVRPGCRRASS